MSRTDPNSRKKTISEIKRRANSGGKWPHIAIFPEGSLKFIHSIPGEYSIHDFCYFSCSKHFKFSLQELVQIENA